MNPQPQNNKKILLSFFVLLLFFGVGIFLLSNGNKNNPKETSNTFQSLANSKVDENGFDTNTFTFLDSNDFYAKDKTGVYFQGNQTYLTSTPTPNKNEKIEGADLATFEYINGWYSKDKKNVYIATDPIEGADTATFITLPDSKGFFRYAKDKNTTYYGGKPVVYAHAKSFKALLADFGMDDTNLFYEGKIVNGADPATFQFITSQYPFYAKDMNQVYVSDYHSSPIIAGADPATFTTIPSSDDKSGVLVSQYSKDKTHVFWFTHLVSEADPKTFTLTRSEYDSAHAKDENSVFMSGEIISHADPGTFSTQGWKIYRDTELGFEISYPPTWLVIEENEHTRYIGFRNPESEFKDYSEVIQVFKNLTWKDAVAKAGFKTPAEALKELDAMGINISDKENTYLAFDGIGPPSSVSEINVNGMRGLIANITTRLFTIENNVAIAGDGQRVLLYTPDSTLLIYGYDNPEIFNIMIQSVKLLP